MSEELLPAILLVEDDLRLRETLGLEFRERGYRVHSAASLREISEALFDDLRFGVIDLRLGGDNGLKALALLRERNPACRIVMLTGYGSIATAVSAMKLGAVSYLTKPVDFATLEQHLLFGAPAETRLESAPPSRESLDRHEREYIEYVLLKCDGNISQAAKWLNIHRQSLQRKLRKLSFGSR